MLGVSIASQPGAGKQADIAIMSLGPLAMWPVHDAVATVVMQGSGVRVRRRAGGGQIRPNAAAGCLAPPIFGAIRRQAGRLGERILGA